MAAKLNPQKKQQHIGLLFSNFAGAGIQRVFLSIAKALLERDWQVDLILIHAEGPLKSEIPLGAHLVDLKAGRSSRSLGGLIHYLKTEKPDILLSSQTHINVVAIIAKKLSGWKGRLFLTEHITIDFAAQNAANWKDRFLPFLAWVFYRAADGVVLVSKETAEHFIKATHLPEKLVHVIYNPVVSEKLIDQSKLPIDHEWFTLPNTQVILSAGRLTKQKDFDTLLYAFALVAQEKPSAKLLILGDGQERTRLENLVVKLGLKDKAQFIGFVNNPFAYMAKASVFVLSSRWEGFANVLVEAMGCGTPVVSTDCPSGPSEILDKGKFGQLVPVGDSAAMAKAILAELENPHDREILIQRANEFSIDVILPQYLDLFNTTGTVEK